MKKSELKQLIKEVLQEVSPVTDTQFQLYIELGNEASQKENIPEMLEKVAKMVRSGREDGKIVDLNGNVVGEFSFQES